jgi:hypothetical protein
LYNIIRAFNRVFFDILRAFQQASFVTMSLLHGVLVFFYGQPSSTKQITNTQGRWLKAFGVGRAQGAVMLH